MRRGRWSLSTGFTTRVTKSPTCARGTATSSPARPTSSTVRTSGCCGAGASCSRGSTRRGWRLPPLRRSLAGRDVFVAHGDFYAATVARVLGHERDGFVRAGCAAYTTSDEIERLIDGVRRLV